MAPQYGEVDYWDERYLDQPQAFDWYQGYLVLRPLLRKHLPPDQPLLQIGVGTSTLQVDMAEDGYRRLINTDYSSVAIEIMQQLHSGYPGLSYRVSDCRSMPEFDDASFRSVLDKGTLDAILCGTNSHPNAAVMLQEVYRVLERGGSFMEITYGSPDARLPHLAAPGLDWDIQAYSLSRGSAAASPADQPHPNPNPSPTTSQKPLRGGDSSPSMDGREAAAEEAAAEEAAAAPAAAASAAASLARPGVGPRPGGEADGPGQGALQGEKQGGRASGSGGGEGRGAVAAAGVGRGCGGQEQEGEEEEQEEVPPAGVRIGGPYSADDQEAMRRLADMRDIHYVYVCTKRGSTCE